jgi:hypothetical protein
VQETKNVGGKRSGIFIYYKNIPKPKSTAQPPIKIKKFQISKFKRKIVPMRLEENYLFLIWGFWWLVWWIRHVNNFHLQWEKSSVGTQNTETH